MRRAYLYALFAAASFGLSVPLSKRLLDHMHFIMLAGLLYLGAACAQVAVTGLRRVTRDTFTTESSTLRRADLPWLIGLLAIGGVAAPLLQLTGLKHTPAATASLLLGLEAMFTIALA